MLFALHHKCGHGFKASHQMKSCSSNLLTQHPTPGISTVAGIELNVGTINGGTVLQIIHLGPFQNCLQISLNHHQHLIYIVGHMSDASDASDAVSDPSTVFSRVAASAAWKRLNRLMPALACRKFTFTPLLLLGFLALIPWYSAASESTAVPSVADAARA